MKRWRRLSPAGLGAVVVLQLVGGASDLEFVDHAGVLVGTPASGRVRHAFLRDGSRVVDEVLLVGTAEGIELHLHGGEVLLAAVISLLERHGFEPDRSQQGAATALSLRHARALLSNQDGPLAALIGRMGDPQVHAGESEDLLTKLSRALALSDFAKRLAHPAVVRIVGRPNAGKSTLFNAWVGRERALVSPQAGTTRDTVQATVLLHGVPIVLEDTAGREPSQIVGSGADLLVYLLIAPEEAARITPTGVRVVTVLGRADERGAGLGIRAVSGRTGAGLDALLEDVAQALAISRASSDDAWAPVDEQQALALRAAARDLGLPA